RGLTPNGCGAADGGAAGPHRPAAAEDLQRSRQVDGRVSADASHGTETAETVNTSLGFAGAAG
ncbi:hypothetical protein, partial [Frankia sp. AgKG'84/4]|uniref:hypothetical protein n=1 Tax=Frankia sp. AgKG'84/4 TaxID=573490 RepID=UPI002029E5AF